MPDGRIVVRIKSKIHHDLFSIGIKLKILYPNDAQNLMIVDRAMVIRRIWASRIWMSNFSIQLVPKPMNYLKKIRTHARTNNQTVSWKVNGNLSLLLNSTRKNQLYTSKCETDTLFHTTLHYTYLFSFSSFSLSHSLFLSLSIDLNRVHGSFEYRVKPLRRQ